MERWQKKSLLFPFLLVVVALCIFFYTTYCPPTIPGNFIPQDISTLTVAMDVVKFGYPLVASVLIVWIISNPFALMKSVRNLRQLKAGNGRQPPRDGSVIAVTGQIIADNMLVTTPAGRTSCIAYYYYVRKGLNRKLDYFGYAFTPCYINASFGKVRIFAVPHIDFFSKPGTAYTDRSALDNIKTYFHSNSFVKSLVGWAPFYKERNISMTDRMRPVKGDVVLNWKSSDHDIEGCTIVEQCLDEGETVCVFGMYSGSQNGIVHNPESGDPFSVKIKRVPIAILIREQKFFIVRMITGTMFMLATLMVMAWVYHHFFYIYETLFNLL